MWVWKAIVKIYCCKLYLICSLSLDLRTGLNISVYDDAVSNMVQICIPCCCWENWWTLSILLLVYTVSKWLWKSLLACKISLLVDGVQVRIFCFLILYVRDCGAVCYSITTQISMISFWSWWTMSPKIKSKVNSLYSYCLCQGFSHSNKENH